MNKAHFFICCIAQEKNFTSLQLFSAIQSFVGDAICAAGPVENWHAPIEYIDEMGENLNTVIFDIPMLRDKQWIVALKRFCSKKKKKNSINKKRLYNMNPGFISQNGLFLATHKDSETRSRTPITETVFIEQELEVHDGQLYPLPNAFSEYVADERLGLFNKWYKAL